MINKVGALGWDTHVYVPYMLCQLVT